MAKNISLLNTLSSQIQEAQHIPNRRYLKKITLGNIMNRSAPNEDKEKTLKAARGKNTGHIQRTKIRNNEAIRQWSNFFKVWTKRNNKARIPYPAKLSNKNEGKIETLFKHTKAKRAHH